MDHGLFICSLTKGQVGYFQVWAIMNKTLWTPFCRFLCRHKFSTSLGKYRRAWLLNGLRFVRSPHADIHSDGSTLHLHQQGTRAPTALLPRLHSLPSAIMTGVLFKSHTVFHSPSITSLHTLTMSACSGQAGPSSHIWHIHGPRGPWVEDFLTLPCLFTWFWSWRLSAL